MSADKREVYQTINPATGEVVKTFPTATDEEIQKALAVADEVFQKDWRFRSVKERADIVRKAADILESKSEEYAKLVTLEMGKLLTQARMEVTLSVRILKYYADNGERLLAPSPIAGSNGAIQVNNEPIGIIFAIEPWNFPYYQLARVAGPQLVTGNVMLAKHAPSVPQCALAFARLFEEAGAPAGVYTNVFASITQSGTIIDDFRVRGVTLTGSERAGAAVAERAGKNLKKVVLELGGSDPLIVFPDADFEPTLNLALIGRLMNTGQACVASKRIIVIGKERGDEFIKRYTEAIKSLSKAVGDPNDEKTSIGPLVSEQALNGLLSQIESAKKHGATILAGGKRINRPGWYLEPTVITNIKPDNPLYREETFGPVASFYIVDTEEEAIRLANDTSYGLGASIFSKDIAKAQEVAKQIDSGMVFINQPAQSLPHVPFGGVKNSGFGRELGELGMTEFVNKKVISAKSLL
ncbi:aldehyde dehydrogenase (NAD(P)(+)) ALD5 [Sugiyamaella lignohabitans]|uniref:Aldehyde dehydrogenase (NAD(P)(+)) ALD5 n=1 Tax=Sugiyamaella lignohabitans TaxID=796027 RepID=A0A167CUJ1_9ASCO|nr:aldehyde dehydrogenase (NAD(P)(+)) ALD5 [Sugiyamaella lignohabitans]ANB12121.1 aldehyde dehydrogenase (NAD(P)(+)) ALD5 [Sugiyamaella lignohabitans]